MKVIIENVRSISGYHVVPLRKLTLLVGENSSGKSTFLASVAAVSDSQAFPGTAAFNEPPYDLGGYDTIATFKGGRGGRAKTFGLGFSSENNGKTIEAFAKYAPDHGETRLCTFELNTPDGNIDLHWADGNTYGKITGIEGYGEITLDRMNAPSAKNFTDGLIPLLVNGMTSASRSSLVPGMIEKIFRISEHIRASITSAGFHRTNPIYTKANLRSWRRGIRPERRSHSNGPVETFERESRKSTSETLARRSGAFRARVRVVPCDQG